MPDVRVNLNILTKFPIGWSRNSMCMQEFLDMLNSACDGGVPLALAEESRMGIASVFVVPGWPGTELTRSGPLGLRSLIWVSNLALLGGELNLLRLDPDGIRDDSFGRAFGVGIRNPLPQYYHTLCQSLGRFFNVIPWGWDWRQEFDLAGELLADAIQESPDPVYIVAHSAGGLVARDAMLRLRPAPGARVPKVARLVTLGTPHYGSWTAVMLYAGLNDNYRWLMTAVGLSPAGLITRFGRDYLDPVIATWPGLPCMFPNLKPAIAGMPVYNPYIWQASSYGAFNRYVTQNTLDRGQAFCDRIAAATFPDQMVCVVGLGSRTAQRLVLPQTALNAIDSYYIDPNGDNTTPVWSSLPPDSPRVFCQVSHEDLPLEGLILEQLPRLLLSGATDGEVLN